MQLLEFGAAPAQVARVLAGGGHQAHGNGLLEALDDENVAVPVRMRQARRSLAVLGLDVVDIAVRRLRDMIVGRYRLPGHRFPLPFVASPCPATARSIKRSSSDAFRLGADVLPLL